MAVHWGKGNCCGEMRLPQQRGWKAGQTGRQSETAMVSQSQQHETKTQCLANDSGFYTSFPEPQLTRFFRSDMAGRLMGAN